jgi:hypothetical protein
MGAAVVRQSAEEKEREPRPRNTLLDAWKKGVVPGVASRISRSTRDDQEILMTGTASPIAGTASPIAGTASRSDGAVSPLSNGTSAFGIVGGGMRMDSDEIVSPVPGSSAISEEKMERRRHIGYSF